MKRRSSTVLLALAVAWLVQGCSGDGKAGPGDAAPGDTDSGTGSGAGPMSIGLDDCIHPPVEADCQGGWCRIPAGCYMNGSPEDEICRGKYSEDLTQVTLTRGFVIA